LIESTGIGCHVASEYIGVVIYADDILSLSASVPGLHSMPDICHRLLVVFTFNHSKSVCMKAGPDWCNPTADMFLGNMKLVCVTSIIYVGSYIC